MTVDSFREELNHITASVIAKINGFRRLGPRGVAISREDLLDHIGQLVFPDGYLVQPNPINIAAGLGPMFRRLPREIRDMIFGEMLASGQPQFLRSSRIMNQEGTSLISKHGVYRVNIGFGSMANCPQIPQQVADTVQNLHLRVNFMDYQSFELGTYPERHILKMFSNSNIGRKSCSASFQGLGTSTYLVAFDVVHSLKSFTGFEEVALRIDTAWSGGMFYPDHLHAWQRTAAHRIKHLSLDLACREVEPDLGTAYLVQKREGPQLVFYPRYSDQSVMKDSAGKDKCKWVMWEDRKDVTAF